MHKYLLRNNSRGFSLIELAMLLAIVGIMAGFSIPVLNSTLQDVRLIGDARNIATGLTYAKLSAVSQTTRCRLSFDLGNNQWSTTKLNRTSGSYEAQGSANWLTNGGSPTGAVFNTSSSSSPSGFPTSSSTTITFNSRGIPIEGPSVIYVSNSGSNYAVTVSLSGKVQVLRLRQNQWVPQ